MKNSISNLTFAGICLILLGAFAFAQEESDNSVPLVGRVMSLMSQIPPDAFPPLPEIQLKPVRPGLFAHLRPVFEIASADGKFGAGTTDGALYIREIDGGGNKIVAKPSGNWRWDVEGAKWSPNGKKIAVRMIDDSQTPRIPIVNWLGKNEEVSTKPYSRAGEALPVHALYIVDTMTGEAVQIKNDNNDPYFHILDWNAAGNVFYFLSADRFTHRLGLFSADAESGAANLIYSETSESGAMWWSMLQGYDNRMASQKLVTILSDGRFIWTSEKSGFAHIYLHDLNGKPIRSLTEGKTAGFVDRIIDIDEKDGFAYAIMQGTDQNSPYVQTLYRFPLADGKAQKLVDGPTIMLAFLSDDKKTVIIHRSGLPKTLEIMSLNADGSDKKIIWSPELSFLKDYGFSPEIVSNFAADGKTKLRSLILKPQDFDPKNSYPVLEWIYGGPHTNVFTNDLTDPQILQLQELANQGFIIVLTDGRGTPGRGRNFQDFSRGRFGQVEIADHAAVLRELGKSRNYMDLKRVGIFGHSWGGYFSLRALLQEPELYKAGVLMAPVADISSMRVAVESFMGCLPAVCPEVYKAGDSLTEIGKLKAPVMIIHGTADDDIPISESVKIVDALQKAGKEHQFILLSGTDHIVQRSPITFPNTSEFFKNHLSLRP